MSGVPTSRYVAIERHGVVGRNTPGVVTGAVPKHVASSSLLPRVRSVGSDEERPLKGRQCYMTYLTSHRGLYILVKDYSCPVSYEVEGRETS